MNCFVQNLRTRIGKPRLVVLAGLLLTMLGAFSGCQQSSVYPSRPITLVCPWAVGGGTDRVSRQMAVFLESELGTPVNVVNATGGQGVTGHSRGIRAKPDGYTISMMTLELSMLHWRNLTDLTWEDAAPLMSLNEDPAALFVKSDSEFQTVKDLEAAIKDRPGKLKASGTAALAAWHLALAGVADLARSESDRRYLDAVARSCPVAAGTDDRRPRPRLLQSSGSKESTRFR